MFFFKHRFLLEWLSFLHRYVPVGILERPQKINERPPHFIGRNDLETLMASQKASDWIKIRLLFFTVNIFLSKLFELEIWPISLTPD